MTRCSAAAVSTPVEMWEIGDDLDRQRREIDRTFDYRYSQLTRVFAELIHAGLMDQGALAGLADAKRADVHRILLSLRHRRGADAVVALGAHDHVAPGDPPHAGAVTGVVEEPAGMGRHPRGGAQPVAPARRLGDGHNVRTPRLQLRRDGEQERARAGEQHAPAGQHALALGQRLRAAGGHHARQRPAGEGDGAVVGAGGQHDGLRPHPSRRARAHEQQHARLDRLTADLQRSALAIRVLALRHVFRRFPPLAREMAGSLGKAFRLVIEGEETEADKSVVEALFEPLLHVLRNAVDHGVEAAGERAAAGKPATATIHLSGYRQGEHVIVEVAPELKSMGPWIGASAYIILLGVFVTARFLRGRWRTLRVLEHAAGAGPEPAGRS